MSCSNLVIPKPLTQQCPTTLFGIPYGAAGRTVAGVTYPISAIVLHCYDGTIAELCNEMKCRVRSSVISGSTENSFHYGIGAPAGSGGFQQFVDDNCISWTFGTYKNNTYATVPPPNIAINWPTLQAEHGINTTPDVYTIDIALAIGSITPATDPSGCYDCPTSSGLDQTQHDQLIQLLAFLVQEYNIPIDIDHIQFHDLIHCGEGVECACKDIATLLAEVAAFCPPCPEEAFSAPVADPTDTIEFIYGATEACCPSSPGCLVKIPWDGCQFGDMANDGTLDDYILGLSLDESEQLCLTRGCLGVTAPIIGCGTVADPLRIELCDWGAYIPDQAADTVVNLVGLDDQGCLIEAPVADVITLYETPITVIDTETIDLTSSGTSGHTIQADVNVSAEPNNQIEVKPDGLFVDFTCIDFVDAYPAGDIVQMLGQDGAGDCIREDAATFVDRLICLIAEDMAAEPTWLLGKTDAECPVFVTPDSIVAAGLEVTDTTTIDLTLVDNTLSGVAIIDPAGDNVLVDNGNGLYVPDITITGNDCINVTDDGNRNYTIVPVLAPAQSGIENNLFCLGTGLFVPKLEVQNGFTINHALSGPYDALLTSDIIFSQNPNNIAGVDFTPVTGGLLVEFGVSPTDCIDIDFTGNVLTATPIIAPTQGLIPNFLQCLPGQGLYVPQGAGLVVTDTNCIDLTILNGVLTADLVVNPSGDNQVSCGPGGLFVPIAAGLVANDTDCVNHSLVGGVLSTTLNIAGPQAGVPNILSCLAGQGLYVPESHINVVDTTCIDMDFTGGVLQANLIIDPTGDNQAQCLPAGLYVPPAAGLSALDTNCIALNLAGTDLTATPILAPTQAGVPNALQCLISGLYVPECAITISDDVANTEDVNCGDTITFDGINGATARVSATDTVTIDGHALCAAGAPNALPPYDTDQAWTYYDTNNNIRYDWNCATQKWETPYLSHVGAAPPDGSECGTSVAINANADAVYTVGITQWILPPTGAETIRRVYELVSDCTWVQTEGYPKSRSVRQTVSQLIPPNSFTLLTLETVVDDELDEWGTPSVYTAKQDGEYMINGFITLEAGPEITDIDGWLGVVRAVINGVPTTNVMQNGGPGLELITVAPPGRTVALMGTQTIRLAAGDTLEFDFEFTNIEGYSADVVLASFDVKMLVA